MNPEASSFLPTAPFTFLFLTTFETRSEAGTGSAPESQWDDIFPKYGFLSFFSSSSNFLMTGGAGLLTGPGLATI